MYKIKQLQMYKVKIKMNYEQYNIIDLYITKSDQSIEFYNKNILIFLCLYHKF